MECCGSRPAAAYQPNDGNGGQKRRSGRFVRQRALSSGSRRAASTTLGSARRWENFVSTSSSSSSASSSSSSSSSTSTSSTSSSSQTRAFTCFSAAELKGGDVGINKKSGVEPIADNGNGGGDDDVGNNNNNSGGHGGDNNNNNSGDEGNREDNENEGDDSRALSISSSIDGSIPTSKVEQLCKEHKAPLPEDMLTMIRTSNGISAAVLMRWFDLATSKSFFVKHVVSKFSSFRNRALMDASFSRRLYTDISIDVALLSFIEFMRVRARSPSSSSKMNGGSSTGKNSKKNSVNRKRDKQSGGVGSVSPSFWDEWEFFACDILAAIGMNAAIVSLVSPAIRTRGSIGLNAFTATRKRGRSVAFLSVSAQVGACCYAIGFVMQALAEALYDARTSSSSASFREGKTEVAQRVGKQFGSFAATSSSPRQHAVLAVERYVEKKVAGAAMVTTSVVLRVSNAVFGSREFQKQQQNILA